MTAQSSEGVRPGDCEYPFPRDPSPSHTDTQHGTNIYLTSRINSLTRTLDNSRQLVSTEHTTHHKPLR